MVVTIICGYELIKGNVVWFNEGKKYGFIHYCLDDGSEREIFFHWNDGADIIYDGFDLNLNDLDINSKFPKKDDSILFAVGRGSKDRPKAFPWCFESDYLKAKTEFDEDPSWSDEEEDHWEENEPREVNLGDSPEGFKIYE